MSLATEIQEYVALHNEYGFREGQRAFNELECRRSDLADELRGTRYDPYYEDHRLGLFYEWLEGRTETEAKLDAIRRRVIEGDLPPSASEYFGSTVRWDGKDVPARKEPR